MSAKRTAEPAGITDTRGWSDDQTRERLDQTMQQIGWANTSGSAKRWWQEFESENQHRFALVLRLAEELHLRNATVTEFFLA